MKRRPSGKFLRASVGASAGALATLALGMPAQAAGTSVVELTEPASTVEAGVGGVSRSSFKFGEYNGLQDRGPFAIGNLDLRGGGRYDSDDASRWAIQGRDLGLDTRSLSLDYGKQGRFRFGIGYDELRRNYSDSYQTPYLGVGSSNFVLPANWLKPLVPQVSGSALNYRSLSTVEGTASAVNGAGLVRPPTSAQLTTLSRIFDADTPAFRAVDLSTKRRTFGTSFGFSFDPQWELLASWRRDHKDGLRAQGAINDALNGNSAGRPQRSDDLGHDEQRPEQSVSPAQPEWRIPPHAVDAACDIGGLWAQYAKRRLSERFVFAAGDPAWIPGRSRDHQVVHVEAHQQAGKPLEPGSWVQVRRARQPDTGRPLHLPGRERTGLGDSLAVQRRARTGAE